MRITVKVNSNHIDKGEVDQPERCPVAFALQDATGDSKAWMGFTRCSARVENKRFGWTVPPKVTKWIHDFDGGKPVVPFQFTLDTMKASQPF